MKYDKPEMETKSVLPDFPKLKDSILKHVDKFVNQASMKESVVSQIRKEIHFEGNETSVTRENGQNDCQGYNSLSIDFKISKEDIIAKGPIAYFEEKLKVMNELEKQIAKSFLNKFEEVANQAGNVIDFKGEPFTLEAYLNILNKIFIEFDNTGNPILPSIVVNPEMKEKLEKRLKEWENDPAATKQINKVLELKRDEWNDRESHRKLVS